MPRPYGPRRRRVHYRSDSVRGLFVGEQQALGLLRDSSRTYNERFDGFIVRKFNGDRVRIANGEVRCSEPCAHKSSSLVGLRANGTSS